MVKAYDDWERLVAAVLHREQFRQLCRLDSLSTISSSDVSSASFRLSSSFSNVDYLEFSNPYGNGLPKYARPLPFGDLARIKVNGEPGLVLFEGSPPALGLQELLKAPSSVLGEDIGAFDRACVVSLGEGMSFVVKRLRTADFSEEKFRRQMDFIGNTEHENIVKLRGYYLSGDVRFVIYDYYAKGSVYAMLHGKRGEINPLNLAWETRIRIAIGAAKGLAHLHSHEKAHGNIKASNIFLNSQGYGCLADVDLENGPLSAYDPPPPVASGTVYVSIETDVYCFGVVLLELLTGRSPVHTFGWRKRKNFVDWARYNARDEWTRLVFDVELLKDPMVKREMQGILALALSCVQKEPQDRPKMKDVVGTIESIFPNF